MKDSTSNKIVGGIFGLLILIFLFIVGLLSWGFIEFVQWVTSQ